MLIKFSKYNNLPKFQINDRKDKQFNEYCPSILGKNYIWDSVLVGLRFECKNGLIKLLLFWSQKEFSVRLLKFSDTL